MRIQFILYKMWVHKQLQVIYLISLVYSYSIPENWTHIGTLTPQKFAWPNNLVDSTLFVFPAQSKRSMWRNWRLKSVRCSRSFSRTRDLTFSGWLSARTTRTRSTLTIRYDQVDAGSQIFRGEGQVGKNHWFAPGFLFVNVWHILRRHINSYQTTE